MFEWRYSVMFIPHKKSQKIREAIHFENITFSKL